MAKNAFSIYPDVFKNDELDGHCMDIISNTAYAQLAVSDFLPHKSKSFSQLQMTTRVHNLLNGFHYFVCLPELALFSHAFETLRLGYENMGKEVQEAVISLGLFLENEKQHVACLSKVLNEEKVSERKMQSVFTHHLFEPLIQGSTITLDKYSGGSSACPFCKSLKKNIHNGSTAFGHKDLWHGRADIVIRHKHIQQVVAVAEEESETEDDEPVVKISKTEVATGDSSPDYCRTGIVEVKTDIKWSILDRREIEQQPFPQVFSQTIVNAFLVVKQNPHLKEFFIPCFLASGKGVMGVMYNVHYDTLISKCECNDLLLDGKLDLKEIFTIWLMLNFDKFELNLSAKAIENFLKPSGFKAETQKYDGVYKMYQEELQEDLEELLVVGSGKIGAFIEKEAVNIAKAIIFKNK